MAAQYLVTSTCSYRFCENNNTDNWMPNMYTISDTGWPKATEGCLLHCHGRLALKVRMYPTRRKLKSVSVYCMLQLGAQSLSDKVQAVASSSQQHQQAGPSKLDTAVGTLMQQESLQGRLHGRLAGLATIPAAQDAVAVNAVLKELCNLVSNRA